ANDLRRASDFTLITHKRNERAHSHSDAVNGSRTGCSTAGGDTVEQTVCVLDKLSVGVVAIFKSEDGVVSACPGRRIVINCASLRCAPAKSDAIKLAIRCLNDTAASVGSIVHRCSKIMQHGVVEVRAQFEQHAFRVGSPSLSGAIEVSIWCL